MSNVHNASLQAHNAFKTMGFLYAKNPEVNSVITVPSTTSDVLSNATFHHQQWAPDIVQWHAMSKALALKIINAHQMHKTQIFSSVFCMQTPPSQQPANTTPHVLKPTLWSCYVAFYVASDFIDVEERLYNRMPVKSRMY